MIFEHFPYIARECSEIVHRGCFRDFLKNYKDCSNIFLRFFGDFFRDFSETLRFFNGSHGARWWGQRPSVIQLRAVIVSLRAVAVRPAGRLVVVICLVCVTFITVRGGVPGGKPLRKRAYPLGGGGPHCKRKRDGRWDHQKVYRFQTGCSPAQSSPAQPSPVSQAAGQPVGEK